MARKDKRTAAFFDRDAVLNQLTKAERKILPRIGAHIRTAARSSLKLGRLVRKADMTQTQRNLLKRREAWAKKHGKPKPPRRRQSANPGEPPRLHDKQSPLKRLIFFQWDSQSRSVVVGPLRSKGNAPFHLEHGWGKWNKFPFMVPAMQKETSKMAPMWRNVIKSES